MDNLVYAKGCGFDAVRRGEGGLVEHLNCVRSCIGGRKSLVGHCAMGTTLAG